jgi:hypothetical protein
MRLHKTAVLEMVLFCHMFALAILLPAAAVAGELSASFWWLFMNPSAFGLMVLFCICGFFGEWHFLLSKK